MDNDNRNFILAIALSFLVLLGWQLFVVEPQQAPPPSEAITPLTPAAPLAPQELASNTPPAPADFIAPPSTTSEARVPIRSANLAGSLNLVGAKLDDLQLSQYPVSLTSDTPIRLFSPEIWFAQSGWIGARGQNIALPDSNSQWQLVRGATLTPDTPITLRWRNAQGVVFERDIALDEDFLFTITERVQNGSPASLTLFPYAQLVRAGEPKSEAFFIIHEGGVGVLGESGLVEHSYADMREEPLISQQANRGWIGLTDKYWASILIPPQNAQFQARFSSQALPTHSAYRTDYRLPATLIPAGASTSHTAYLFAGAKRVQLIDGYHNERDIYRFDLLIDWGWFPFLTKPLFALLAWFYNLVGNYGIAILLATIIIRIVFYPLANRGFAAMAQMKKIQPRLVDIRTRYADDKMRQQQELVKLYRETKINPLAGCLPVLLQIPVFFALYKVLFVTLDMRHQPFFGWIHDLSAPDPTSLFNLFGLLPFGTPSWLTVGVWPLIMGFTMFVQMQMNPPPPDPIQQRVFQLMPIVFTFILAGFPAGLVIYWAWNNILSCAQQAVIMKRHGVAISLWENLGLKSTAQKSEE